MIIIYIKSISKPSISLVQLFIGVSTFVPVNGVFWGGGGGNLADRKKMAEEVNLGLKLLVPVPAIGQTEEESGLTTLYSEECLKESALFLMIQSTLMLLC